MPVPGTLEFQVLLIGFVLLVFLLVRRQWRASAARKEEVFRLVAFATEQSYMAEVRAVANYEYVSAPKVHRCAVCLYPTTTRCAQCKSVRYCSSKCQILHWRQGHKDECCPPSGREFEKEETFKSDDSRVTNMGFPSHGTGNESLAESTENGHLNHGGASVDVDCDISRSRPNDQTQASSKAMDFSRSLSHKNNLSETRKLNRQKTRTRPEEVDSATMYSKGKAAAFSDVPPRTFSTRKSARSGDSLEMSNLDQSSLLEEEEGDLNVLEHGKAKSLRNGGSTEMPSSLSAAHASTGSKTLLPSKSGDKPYISLAARSGLKASVQKVVQHFRASNSSKLPQSSSAIDEVTGRYNFKMSFPYETFVKLYFCDGVELHPFGLVNCGNSCYANAVLQCLAFTRPLMSYLFRGLHSKACRKKSWCFVCEFQHLILKVREGESPLSPIKILSKLQKIAKHLGPGRQEDAHEFLRCAVDTMQSVFLKEADAANQFAEDTTLIGLTFGGYLHSKIKCMHCRHKSERSELMMDLTVEIEGDIGSLEEALTQFTAYEVLDGNNRYYCGRCKSYKKAKKKLMILEAPNILTIVLKRFQSDNFEKLSKRIYFPEVLDIAPYMNSPNDSSPLYSLYAVVVHLDVMNTAYSGHYVCYIKTLQGEWFRIDDSTVTHVELETVLLEEAYMLLYARHSPRPPASLSKNVVVSRGRKSKERRNLEAIPSSRDNDPLFSSITKQRDCKVSLSGSHQRMPRVDSSSGSLSSLFSSSDTSSCSTSSTRDSHLENLSDYLFGGH
ncbi:PREDICTED: ubiquitin carboxyl-terminal hydrolase 17 [Tarenaya hassleriana]|uniref:ubiquitin carboxyl-terminal hydrolase 17 n=1 Tax=Tarenaya hassleriana TaxID=28532 RepID=UPI00053C9524|nr:PREDICTED: ubiquitin carboxyl-terminal hydrolase 17 [Tarenaya hassleriana]